MSMPCAMTMPNFVKRSPELSSSCAMIFRLSCHLRRRPGVLCRMARHLLRVPFRVGGIWFLVVFPVFPSVPIGGLLVNARLGALSRMLFVEDLAPMAAFTPLFPSRLMLRL